MNTMISDLLKYKTFLIIALAFLLIVTSISCNREQNEANNKNGPKTGPVTYKRFGQKKTDLKLSHIYSSKDGNKILAVSSEQGKALFLDKFKTVWTKSFKGLGIKMAALSENGEMAFLSLEKKAAKGKDSKAEKSLVLLSDKGSVIWQKKFKASNGFFNIYISSSGEKAAAFYYPYRPSESDYPFYIVFDEKGAVMAKEINKKAQFIFDSVSKDIDRFMVGLGFMPQSKNDKALSVIKGYEDNSEVFTSSPVNESISGHFSHDKDYYAVATPNSNKLSLYKWKQQKPMWTKKVEPISDVKTYVPSDVLMARAHIGAYQQTGSKFFSIFNLFSFKGKKLWQYELEEADFYDSRVSADGKKVVLFPTKYANKPSYLFTDLSKGGLPQKLPKNTSSAAFFNDSSKLVIATSKGEVILLKIK